jgi:hypothetical protein
MQNMQNIFACQNMLINMHIYIYSYIFIYIHICAEMCKKNDHKCVRIWTS